MIDVSMARYCAQLVEQFYRGRVMHPALRAHIDSLRRGSVGATEDGVRQGQSSHDDDWITTSEAAAILECSAAYVRRIAYSLGGEKRGRGDWWFPRTVVADYAQQRRQQRCGPGLGAGVHAGVRTEAEPGSGLHG